MEINREGQRFPESLNITRAAIGTDDNFAHGVPVTLFAERIGVPIVSLAQYCHVSYLNKVPYSVKINFGEELILAVWQI